MSEKFYAHGDHVDVQRDAREHPAWELVLSSAQAGGSPEEVAARVCSQIGVVGMRELGIAESQLIGRAAFMSMANEHWVKFPRARFRERRYMNIYLGANAVAQLVISFAWPGAIVMTLFVALNILTDWLQCRRREREPLPTP